MPASAARSTPILFGSSDQVPKTALRLGTMIRISKITACIFGSYGPFGFPLHSLHFMEKLELAGPAVPMLYDTQEYYQLSKLRA